MNRCLTSVDHRPRFPGAASSPVSTKMEFLNPKNLPPIPTFRVMNMDGDVEDKSRTPPDVTHEQVLGWYKNMLTGRFPLSQLRK